MKITVYSSGSAGNCTLVEMGKYNILVDVGITLKSINENLLNNNLTMNNINAILITHEHTDHIRAFSTILKYENAVIYLTKGTFDYILSTNKTKYPKVYDTMLRRVNEGSIVLLTRLEKSIYYPSICLDGLEIKVLPTFHDAAESIGFTFISDEQKLVYITDTGIVHESLHEIICNADAYILESNHDPVILMHSSRPYNLKMRILSDHGHMSNEDSMVTLANVMGDKTKLVMHAHISQECNLTQIVEMTREKVFNDYGIATDDIKFVILGPYRSEVYEV